MRTVDLKVYLIAKSEVQPGKIEGWLRDQEVSGAGRARLVDLDNKTDAEMIVELAGRRCYKSFEPGLNANVTKIREDVVEYIDNILKVGHGSVLEHVYFSFAIENVSRVFTGEMNRHRAGMAISEGSMRYIRFEDIPFWMPDSIQATDAEELQARDYADEAVQGDLRGPKPLGEKKLLSQDVFKRAFTAAEGFYKELNDIWAEELAPESKFHLKKQITSMMRRIIPMGVATGGVWTGNIRALRHIFNMRCDEAAEEEILHVANMMLEIMQESEPTFFKDFAKNEKGFYRPKYAKV